MADTETLRPNASGDVTQHLIVGASTNWEAVDEAESDEDATYVYHNDINGYDLYNLPAHSVGSGIINFIKVYVRCRETAGYQQITRVKIKTGGTEYDNGADIQLTTSHVTYNHQWNDNPKTEVAWTWDDIDALQIGVLLGIAAYHALCTQVYVEVDYTPVVAAGKSYGVIID